MDYSKITADVVRGPEIGRLYVDASPFVTTLAKIAYQSFASQVLDQYRTMVECDRVSVWFTDRNPYPSHLELAHDVREYGVLKVHRTQPDQAHPVLDNRTNDLFRAVHDYFGHLGGRTDQPVSFSRHGEEAAWIRHSRMFFGLGRRAMTTETRGQNSAFIWINDGKMFPPQKAVLLPDWVSTIPERWA